MGKRYSLEHPGPARGKINHHGVISYEKRRPNRLSSLVRSCLSITVAPQVAPEGGNATGQPDSARRPIVLPVPGVPRVLASYWLQVWRDSVSLQGPQGALASQVGEPQHDILSTGVTIRGLPRRPFSPWGQKHSDESFKWIKERNLPQFERLTQYRIFFPRNISLFCG